MKTDVLFEKKDNKLVITLDKDPDYAEIRAKLVQVLDSSSNTFDGVKGAIVIKGRRLSSDEENEIRSLIAEKTELEVKIEGKKWTDAIDKAFIFSNLL